MFRSNFSLGSGVLPAGVFSGGASALAGFFIGVVVVMASLCVDVACMKTAIVTEVYR